MILLATIVEVSIGPMYCLPTQHFFDSCGIRTFFVSGCFCGFMPDGSDRLFKESSGILHIAGFEELEGYQFAPVINGSLEIMPLFFDFYERLVRIP